MRWDTRDATSEGAAATKTLCSMREGYLRVRLTLERPQSKESLSTTATLEQAGSLARVETGVTQDH